MFRKRILVLATAMVAILLSCNDNARYAYNPDTQLSQEILFIPESLYGIANSELTPTRRDTIHVGTSARLRGLLKLGGNTLSQDEIDYYVSHYFWTVNGESQSVYGLESTFEEPGKYEAALYAVDYYGDTLADTITLYVDAGTSVSLLEPSNGLNTVDPQASSVLEFRWSLSGIEDWEKPNCVFFMAHQPDSVWSGEGQQVSCYAPLQLQGPWTDSAYYWGIYAWTDTTSWNSAVSPIYAFHPLTAGQDYARLHIPLGLLRQGQPASAHILLTSQGNVLVDTLVASGSTDVWLDRLPSTNQATLIVQAPDFVDYPAETLSVTLSTGALTVSDSVWLEDHTAPLIWPERLVIPLGDSLIFYVTDRGAGLIAGTVLPKIGDSTVTYNRSNSGNRLALPLPCTMQCKLVIEAEDYAGNEVSAAYWQLTRGASGTQIGGPFPSNYEEAP